MRAILRLKSAVAELRRSGLPSGEADPEPLALWPGQGEEPPETKHVVERGRKRRDRFVSPVSRPLLYPYLPPEGRRTGAAVVICPGGAYRGLAIDKEGHDVARWLNTLGIAGFVLQYRTPRPDLAGEQEPWPVQDARRAMRLVRSRAAEWQIDPARVGMLGFSAGGHLAAVAGTLFSHQPGPPGGTTHDSSVRQPRRGFVSQTPSSVGDLGDHGVSSEESAVPDPIERFPARADFLVLVYPVITLLDPVAEPASRRNLLGESPSPALLETYSPERQVTAATPPAFLVQAKDDSVKVQNSILFHEAMQKAGVPSALQLFEKGGHGYGLGIRGGKVASWPRLCEEWLGRMLNERSSDE